MHRKILSCILATCCITILGCAQGNKTLVENEGESISQIKDYQGALAPDFQFLGKVKGSGKTEWNHKLRGASLESESLLYGRVSNGNVVEAGVIVRTYKILGESGEILNSFFPENERTIDSGSMEIDRRKITYALAAKQDILDRDEKKLLGSKGLIMKDCYLIKDYRYNPTRLFNKSKSQMLFFDSVPAGKAGLDCVQLTKDMLPEKDKSLLSEFNQQADTCISTLLAGKPSGESAAGKQAAKESDTGTPVSTAAELENKLATLKKLLDSGLITQSDYEKKKAELLEKF